MYRFGSLRLKLEGYVYSAFVEKLNLVESAWSSRF